MVSHLRSDIRNSTYDGMFAHMFATLTGGVFLMGFALHLGMSDLEIGMLAALPFLVTVFQLPASYLILKNGRRKGIAFGAALLARITWAPILIVALFPSQSFSNMSLLILVLIFLSYTFASIGYVAWLSWMSDLVPEEMRGRFFGTRNMLCGASGMIIMVIFGKLMDSLHGRSLGALPIGFILTFVSALMFGIVSLSYIKRVSEPVHSVMATFPVSSSGGLVSIPFRDPNFRLFLVFAFLWGFSVYFASPFFTLYFLRELKFSYGFVAALGMLSAFADLIGMHIWGRISDRVKNKAVIKFAGWVAIFLPLAWVTVRPENIFMPVILHIVGGGFWAGINLCLNNLLLSISQKENRTFFLSTYNIMGGLGAATGPILAGFFLNAMGDLNLRFFTWHVIPLQFIFLASTLFRMLSFQIFKRIHEPEEIGIGEAIRIIRSVRGLNLSNGFSSLLHPFIAIEKENPDQFPETSKDKAP
jgi:MFS family permease